MKIYKVTYSDNYRRKTYIIAADNESYSLTHAINAECGTYLDGTPYKPQLDYFSEPELIPGASARKAGILTII